MLEARYNVAAALSTPQLPPPPLLCCSVLKQSSAELITEIILVDDSSEDRECMSLKQKLNVYVTTDGIIPVH